MQAAHSVQWHNKAEFLSQRKKLQKARQTTKHRGVNDRSKNRKLYISDNTADCNDNILYINQRTGEK